MTLDVHSAIDVYVGLTEDDVMNSHLWGKDFVSFVVHWQIYKHWVLWGQCDVFAIKAHDDVVITLQRVARFTLTEEGRDWRVMTDLLSYEFVVWCDQLVGFTKHRVKWL